METYVLSFGSWCSKLNSCSVKCGSSCSLLCRLLAMKYRCPFSTGGRLGSMMHSTLVLLALALMALRSNWTAGYALRRDTISLGLTHGAFANDAFPVPRGILTSQMQLLHFWIKKLFSTPTVLPPNSCLLLTPQLTQLPVPSSDLAADNLRYGVGYPLLVRLQV